MLAFEVSFHWRTARTLAHRDKTDATEPITMIASESGRRAECCERPAEAGPALVKIFERGSDIESLDCMASKSFHLLQPAPMVTLQIFGRIFSHNFHALHDLEEFG
jgi:hypothetical protein